jgi:hypothetical protein
MKILTLALLLLALFVVACSAETLVRFRLRRFAEDDDRFTIQSYAGRPERAFPLTLSFSVPRAFYSAALWDESATQGDLPGLYAAVYLSSADPIRRELAERPGMIGANALVALPRLRLQSLGTSHTWPVNATVAQPALELHAAYSNRGLFLLGPGSAVWLKARFARLSATELQLRDSINLAGYRALPCQYRDARGRCVLQQDAYVLHLEANSGHVRTVHVKAPGSRVILDLDSYDTILPSAVAARLRKSSTQRNATARVDWAPLDGGPSWLLARASDLTPAALQSGGTSRAAYAVAESGDDLVIGRALALRLFAEMVYDSSTATWYVLAADVSERYSAGVRWVLALSLILQALLMARQLLSPDQITFGNVLESLYAPKAPATEPHVLHWGYSCALVATAVVQLALGQVYLGAGADTDLVRVAALRDLGITVSVAAGCFVALHVALLVVMKVKATYTWSFEFIASATYVQTGLCGLGAALLPRAAQGTAEIVLLAAILALLLFLTSYYFLAAGHVIVRRFLARRPKSHSLFTQTTLVWASFAAVQFAFVVAFVFAGAEFVFAETVALLSVMSGAATAVSLTQGLFLVILIACVYVVQAEVLDVDLCYLDTVAGKSD